MNRLFTKIKFSCFSFKVKSLFFVFFLVHTSSYANNCNETVKEIYQNIISSIGNNSLLEPNLQFSTQERSVAFMSSQGITIEQKVIDLFCGTENFEDKIAYIISHELAHYYLEHSWMSNTGLSYASSIGGFIEDSSYTKEQRKLAETQADLYAGFYGQISGYNTLGYGSIALSKVYESYGLPKELPKYPSFDERLEIINSRIKIADDLVLLFELGNIFLKNKNYNSAKYCFEFILKSKFNSREIYNNLGLSYLLYGISISEKPISTLVYPIYIDQQTRAEVTTTRSGSFTDSPEEMILKSYKLFNRALALDSSYLPAKQNLLVSDFLQKSTKNERKDFVKGLKVSGIDSKIISDFNLINAVLEHKSSNKITKLARKGSYVSRLNASNLVGLQKTPLGPEDVLKRLDINLMELIMLTRGKRIKGTRFDVKNMGDIQLIEDKKLTVFKIPIKRIEDLFTEKEQVVFHKTKKGIYYVYER